jgi:hypothetical protein
MGLALRTAVRAAQTNIKKSTIERFHHCGAKVVKASVPWNKNATNK